MEITKLHAMIHTVCPFLDGKPSSNRMDLIESSDPKASENSCFAFETLLMEAHKSQLRD